MNTLLPSLPYMVYIQIDLRRRGELHTRGFLSGHEITKNKEHAGVYDFKTQKQKATLSTKNRSNLIQRDFAECIRLILRFVLYNQWKGSSQKTIQGSCTFSGIYLVTNVYFSIFNC